MLIQQSNLMYIDRMTGSSLAQPPSFARMAGHPVRWRLLAELAVTDRRVRELVARTGQPQNLISYHLRRLLADGLVAARRSTFDGREAYYRLQLSSCAEALAAAGTALHPGLRLAMAPAPTPVGACRVLFLCTGNSARSPVAEALLRRRAPTVEVASAGSHPKPLHPNTVRVLRGYDVDVTGRKPQHLDALANQSFDYVITLCDRIREICPEFRGGRQVHWSIPDPAATAGPDPDTYPEFEAMAAELDTRIGYLLGMLAAAQQSESLEEAR
jgi:ArsR family transcriptional regulator, arsenate/arsenite/antimonite-responsive transcriptional repressor / arsenate reductase (thioredoxin)